MKPARRTLLALCALVLLGETRAASAAEFYVSPTAGANGTGTISNPWRLQTALDHPAAVDPGDTIWLRGGTYTGQFTSSLAGTSANPIIVRQYPGERAKLDGNYGGNDFTLDIHGAYTWYWGFEIMNSDPGRWSSDPNDPPARRGTGVSLYGDGCRLINMVIHDTAQGVLSSSAANAVEISGSLIYYNGYDASDRGHGHGAYVANDPGNAYKKVYDNIIFQQFGYGIHGYSEGGDLDKLDYQGNTVFDNGGLSTHGWTTNILLGGLVHAASPKMISNSTYNQDHQSANNLGYSSGCANATVTDNYFEGGTALKIVNCTAITMTGNTFYGSILGFSQGAYPSNTYYSSRPSGVKVFVRPNAYEAKRANITVYNWALQSSVSVDVSGILSPGDGYEVRNAADFFGAPVLQGTYSGGSLSLPMNGLSVATPVGVVAPPRTGPDFNVFVLLPASGGGTPTNTPTKTPTPAPPTATRTPSRTSTRTATSVPPTATRTPTRTSTPPPPTATRTPSRTPTRTNTPPPPTATRTPSRTNTPPAPTATRTPSRTATVPPNSTPTPTPTPTPNLIRAEAEATALVAPMTASPDAMAYGGAFITSLTQQAGTASWQFAVAQPGNYVVWCRVRALDELHDSFFVRMDGGAEDVFDVAEGTWGPDWQWSRVNGRDGTGNPETLDPRVFTLTAGTHEIKFRERDRTTRLDRVIITNDFSFVPTEGDVTTFSDAPPSNPFHDFIEVLARNDITQGCGGTLYCPSASVTRAQMAVMLLKAKHGSDYTPPAATGRVFSDVAANAFAAAWIEQLAEEEITTGCGNGRYCPSSPVTRAQMAVFLLRARHGPDYTPPPSEGIFPDVLPGPFRPWIEQLAEEGISVGCGNGNFCPNAANTRGQMAPFLTRTFQLP